MTLRTLRGLLALAVLTAAAACSKSPAQPSAVIGTPALVQPVADAQIGFSSQPITLTVLNATVSGGSTATYTFEVATDSAFGAKVQTKNSVAQGPNGQTSVALDSLTSGKDYYWHVRAESGSTLGSFTAPSHFSVVPISAPVPLSPTNGVTVSGWPTLIVADVSRSGSGGTLSYRFDVSASATFAPLLFTTIVAEMPTQTSYQPSGSAPTTQTTMYWRAVAFDPTNGTSSPTSTVQTFVLNSSKAAGIAAKEGISLWPGTQPPGASGQATLGDSWNVQTVVSFGGVTHVTPTIDELRVFDLLDRGYDPQSAINWINSNGYFTNAAWYPGPQVVGFDYEYMAYIGGSWSLVFKGE